MHNERLTYRSLLERSCVERDERVPLKNNDTDSVVGYGSLVVAKENFSCCAINLIYVRIVTFKAWFDERGPLFSSNSQKSRRTDIVI